MNIITWKQWAIQVYKEALKNAEYALEMPEQLHTPTQRSAVLKFQISKFCIYM